MGVSETLREHGRDPVLAQLVPIVSLLSAKQRQLCALGTLALECSQYTEAIMKLTCKIASAPTSLAMQLMITADACYDRVRERRLAAVHARTVDSRLPYVRTSAEQRHANDRCDTTQ
jgi:hypothetical protein